MATTSSTHDELQLLGEITTHFSPNRTVTGAPARPGDRLSLACQPNGDIRIAIDGHQPLGRLSRRLNWLSPLLQSGFIHVEASIPASRQPSIPASPQPSDPDTCHVSRPASRRLPLTLTVYLRAKGRAIFEPQPIQSPAQALHEIVRRAYQDLEHHPEPAIAHEVVRSLQLLARRDLLPETRLLLALLPGVARELQSARGVRSMAELRQLLKLVQLGDPLHWRGVGLYPLSWPEHRPSPYTLLGAALARQEAFVDEISDHGSVPELFVVNRSDRPILIPEGEVLVGAKQNRVVNVTVLVPPKASLVLPVSCVEQGRWRYDSRGFHAAASAPPSLRSKKTRSVQRNRELHGTAASDQAEVWQEVARHLRDKRVHSATSSLADGYAARATQLDEFQRHFPLPNGTSGALIVRAGRVASLELFDSADTLSALWPRLSQAYFFDALDWPLAAPANPNSEPVERFLDHLAAHARPRVAIGLGDELEINGTNIIGSALIYDSRLCHLAAFTDMQ